jgi:hypothetical protein
MPCSIKFSTALISSAVTPGISRNEVNSSEWLSFDVATRGILRQPYNVPNVSRTASVMNVACLNILWFSMPIPPIPVLRNISFKVMYNKEACNAVKVFASLFSSLYIFIFPKNSYAYESIELISTA